MNFGMLALYLMRDKVMGSKEYVTYFFSTVELLLVYTVHAKACNMCMTAKKRNQFNPVHLNNFIMLHAFS